MTLMKKIVVSFAALAMTTGVATAQFSNGGNAVASAEKDMNAGPTTGGGFRNNGFGGTGRGNGVLWAFINSNGTKARGKGEINSTRLGTGQYEVTFWRNVVQCAYVGNVATSTTGTQPGFMSAARRNGKDNGVFVRTWAPNGSSADLPFVVFIDC